MYLAFLDSFKTPLKVQGVPIPRIKIGLLALNTMVIKKINEENHIEHIRINSVLNLNLILFLNINMEGKSHVTNNL